MYIEKIKTHISILKVSNTDIIDDSEFIWLFTSTQLNIPFEAKKLLWKVVYLINIYVYYQSVVGIYSLGSKSATYNVKTVLV